MPPPSSPNSPEGDASTSRPAPSVRPHGLLSQISVHAEGNSPTESLPERGLAISAGSAPSSSPTESASSSTSALAIAPAENQLPPPDPWPRIISTQRRDLLSRLSSAPPVFVATDDARLLNYYRRLLDFRRSNNNDSNSNNNRSLNTSNRGSLLNSINVISDYIYRTTPDDSNDTNEYNETSQIPASLNQTGQDPSEIFRNRMRDHTTDVSRIQLNYERLMESVVARLESTNRSAIYRDPPSLALSQGTQNALDFLRIRHQAREISDSQYEAQQRGVLERDRQLQVRYGRDPQTNGPYISMVSLMVTSQTAELRLQLAQGEISAEQYRNDTDVMTAFSIGYWDNSTFSPRNIPVNRIPEQLRNLDSVLSSPDTEITHLYDDTNSQSVGAYTESYRLTDDPASNVRESDLSYVDDNDDEDEEMDDDDDDDEDEEEGLLNEFENESDEYYFGYDERPFRSREETSVGQPRNEESLRSDIQSNERLLLSLARQNYANVNTLVLARGRPIDLYFNLDSDNLSGVPLRRQNAIRVGHVTKEDLKDKRKLQRASDNIKELLNNEAKVLQHDISRIISGIKNMRTFQGESPLFVRCPEDDTRNFRNMFYSKLSSYRSEAIFPNLETFMDEYLHKRKHHWLWQKEKKDKQKAIQRGYKRKASTGRSLLSLLIKNERKVKRRKVKSTIVEDEQISFLNKELKTTNPNKSSILVSTQEKEHILNVQFCSAFQSGSTFNVRTMDDDIDNCELVLSNVDYENKNIFGFFRIFETVDATKSYYQQVTNLVHYLCGYDSNSSSLPRSASLLRKLNILNRLGNDKRVTLPSGNLSDGSSVIPIEGYIIDFMTNDLRFLKSPKLDSKIVFRSSVATKMKSSRIRIQLLEWMRIQPFVQFKESYFLKFLNETNKNLLQFPKSKAPRMQKSEALHMTKEFRSNIYELTKDFPWDEDASIPVWEEQKAARQFGPRKYRDFFMDDWERNLAHRLSEQLTRDDSASLVNIQLNYILFTLKVDIIEYLNTVIECYLQKSSMPTEVRDAYNNVFEKILTEEEDKRDADRESQVTTLICSLNRKTREMEIHNTLPFLRNDTMGRRPVNIVNIHASPQTLNDIVRAQLMRDDSELFSANVPACLTAFINRRESFRNPNEELAETMLFGTYKKDIWGNRLGGGNPSYSMV